MLLSQFLQCNPTENVEWYEGNVLFHVDQFSTQSITIIPPTSNAYIGSSIHFSDFQTLAINFSDYKIVFIHDWTGYHLKITYKQNPVSLNDVNDISSFSIYFASSQFELKVNEEVITTIVCSIPSVIEIEAKGNAGSLPGTLELEDLEVGSYSNFTSSSQLIIANGGEENDFGTIIWKANKIFECDFDVNLSSDTNLFSEYALIVNTNPVIHQSLFGLTLNVDPGVPITHTKYQSTITVNAISDAQDALIPISVQGTNGTNLVNYLNDNPTGIGIYDAGYKPVQFKILFIDASDNFVTGVMKADIKSGTNTFYITSDPYPSTDISPTKLITFEPNTDYPAILSNPDVDAHATLTTSKAYDGTTSVGVEGVESYSFAGFGFDISPMRPFILFHKIYTTGVSNGGCFIAYKDDSGDYADFYFVSSLPANQWTDFSCFFEYGASNSLWLIYETGTTSSSDIYWDHLEFYEADPAFSIASITEFTLQTVTTYIPSPISYSNATIQKSPMLEDNSLLVRTSSPLIAETIAHINPNADIIAEAQTLIRTSTPLLETFGLSLQLSQQLDTYYELTFIRAIEKESQDFGLEIHAKYPFEINDCYSLRINAGFRQYFGIIVKVGNVSQENFYPIIIKQDNLIYGLMFQPVHYYGFYTTLIGDQNLALDWDENYHLFVQVESSTEDNTPPGNITEKYVLVGKIDIVEWMKTGVDEDYELTKGGLCR